MRHCYVQPGKAAEIEMGVKAGGDGVGVHGWRQGGAGLIKAAPFFPRDVYVMCLLFLLRWLSELFGH